MYKIFTLIVNYKNIILKLFLPVQQVKKIDDGESFAPLNESS